MWGAYFCMGAYKHNVVVVIKMGAYIHGSLFCVGACCVVVDSMVILLYKVLDGQCARLSFLVRICLRKTRLGAHIDNVHEPRSTPTD